MLAGHALAGRASHPSRLEGGGLAARGTGGDAGAAHCSPFHATWYVPNAAPITPVAFLSPTVGLLLHACTSVVVLSPLSRHILHASCPFLLPHSSFNGCHEPLHKLLLRQYVLPHVGHTLLVACLAVLTGCTYSTKWQQKQKLII